MSGWGTKWTNIWHIGPNTKEVEVDSEALKDWPIINNDKLSPADWGKQYQQEWSNLEREVYNGPDAKFIEKDGIQYVANTENLIKAYARVRNNKVPTHDPYTNPNSFLYYECKCGQILDPGVKRFAALNEAASEAGWKVRFGELYYIPYCVECGKDVE